MTKQELESTFDYIDSGWRGNSVDLNNRPDGDGWRLVTVVVLQNERVQLIWAREVEVT